MYTSPARHSSSATTPQPTGASSSSQPAAPAPGSRRIHCVIVSADDAKHGPRDAKHGPRAPSRPESPAAPTPVALATRSPALPAEETGRVPLDRPGALDGLDVAMRSLTPEERVPAMTNRLWRMRDRTPPASTAEVDAIVRCAVELDCARHLVLLVSRGIGSSRNCKHALDLLVEGFRRVAPAFTAGHSADEATQACAPYFAFDCAIHLQAHGQLTLRHFHDVWAAAPGRPLADELELLLAAQLLAPADRPAALELMLEPHVILEPAPAMGRRAFEFLCRSSAPIFQDVFPAAFLRALQSGHPGHVERLGQWLDWALRDESIGRQAQDALETAHAAFMRAAAKGHTPPGIAGVAIVQGWSRLVHAHFQSLAPERQARIIDEVVKACALARAPHDRALVPAQVLPDVTAWYALLQDFAATQERAAYSDENMRARILELTTHARDDSALADVALVSPGLPGTRPMHQELARLATHPEFDLETRRDLVRAALQGHSGSLDPQGAAVVQRLLLETLGKPADAAAAKSWEPEPDVVAELLAFHDVFETVFAIDQARARVPPSHALRLRWQAGRDALDRCRRELAEHLVLKPELSQALQQRLRDKMAVLKAMDSPPHPSSSTVDRKDARGLEHKAHAEAGYPRHALQSMKADFPGALQAQDQALLRTLSPVTKARALFAALLAPGATAQQAAESARAVLREPDFAARRAEVLDALRVEAHQEDRSAAWSEAFTRHLEALAAQPAAPADGRRKA